MTGVRRRRVVRGWGAPLLLALAASPAAGQLTPGPLPNGARATFIPLGGSELFLAPHASFALGPSLSLTTEAAFGEGSSAFYEGRATLSLLLGGVVLDGTGVLTRRSLEGDHTDHDGVRVGVRGRGGGLSVGLFEDHADARRFQLDSRTFDVRAWADLGARLGVTLRSTTLDEQARITIDTVHTVLDRFRFRTTRSALFFRENRYTEVELDLGARIGRFDASVIGGHRFRDGSESPAVSWGFARLRTPVAPRLELLLEGGRNGGAPGLARGPSSFIRLGLRVDLSPDRDDGVFLPASAPSPGPVAEGPAYPRAIVPDGPGPRHLVVEAPDAASVEVKGDFTGWRNVPLSAGSAGLWTLPVASGVHHLNVRVDGGAWTVPTNLPTVPDDFSGAPVAILVVR